MLKRLWKRVRPFDLERRMDDEMRHHIEEHIEALKAEGMTTEEARKAALKEFGNVEALKEDCRDSWGMQFIENTIRHLRLTGRQMLKNKGFTTTVILTLGLGIGINTMVFSLVNGLFFKSLDVPNGDRLVTISGQDFKQSSRRLPISYPDFVDYRVQNKTFDWLEAIDQSFAVISDEERPAMGYDMARMSSGMLRMLQTNPIVGRQFLDTEFEVGANNVIIIGHDLWESRYDKNPNIIGESLRVNGTSATIVGVMPENFAFPLGHECWMPLIPEEPLLSRNNRALHLFGIHKEDTDMIKAGADIALIAQRIADLPETRDDLGARLLPFLDRYRDPEARVSLLAMQCTVGLVLLIACSNVASLLLGRSIQRRPELNVRTALGAKRGQLIRQLLTESFTLCALGGLLGLFIAVVGTRMFENAVQESLPYWAQFSLDYRVLLFFAGAILFSGLLSGLLPAFKASRADLTPALKDGASTSGGIVKSRLTGILVILQFALTVILLTNAGLMIQSILKAATTNEFVPSKEILMVRMDLRIRGSDRYSTTLERQQLYDEFVRQTRELPGVTHVALTSTFPTVSNKETQRVEIDGKLAEDPKSADQTYVNIQSPEFLEIINLPIVEGRNFLDTDGKSGESFSIVSTQFAERYWPDDSAIGKRFRFLSDSDRSPWKTVVGVSAPIAMSSWGKNTLPVVFIPHTEEVRRNMILLVHTQNDPHTYAQPVRKIVQQLDRDILLYNVQTVKEAKSRYDSAWNIMFSLFILFAIIALLMASLGIYAVVSQSTANRTRELGIRKALGATNYGIQRFALSIGLKQICIGVLVGQLIAMILTRILDNIQDSPLPLSNSATTVCVIALLLVVGLLACWLPARKASRVNPSETLRVE